MLQNLQVPRREKEVSIWEKGPGKYSASIQKHQQQASHATLGKPGCGADEVCGCTGEKPSYPPGPVQYYLGLVSAQPPGEISGSPVTLQVLLGNESSGHLESAGSLCSWVLQRNRTDRITPIFTVKNQPPRSPEAENPKSAGSKPETGEPTV